MPSSIVCARWKQRSTSDLRLTVIRARCSSHTAWQTVIKMITTGFLLALVAGALIKFKVFGGGQ